MREDLPFDPSHLRARLEPEFLLHADAPAAGEPTGEWEQKYLQNRNFDAVSKIARGVMPLGGSNPSPSAQPSGGPSKNGAPQGDRGGYMTDAPVHRSPPAVRGSPLAEGGIGERLANDGT